MTKTTSFDSIAGRLADVQARGDQITAEYAAVRVPFGNELLTETPTSEVRLGVLACIKAEDTQIDDTPLESRGGNDEIIGVPARPIGPPPKPTPSPEQHTGQLPFGSELLTETPIQEARLGALACINMADTQVDDNIIGTNGDKDDRLGTPNTPIPRPKPKGYSEVTALD